MQLGWIRHGIGPDCPRDGGGSRVCAEWTYTEASRTRDKIMLWLIQPFPMRRMIAHGWGKALDRYAQSDPA